ncbi:hypothetical protein C2G38_2240314 [Gigaspora rosea]|uniref:Uncharacterized protein n=1 Tax=Gigaspora rosea TaxID=44941 RepID=A0A397VX92_9GLOM|nr:hypothetical protein C2G38_2240314 [Gigaspora rosea]
MDKIRYVVYISVFEAINNPLVDVSSNDSAYIHKILHNLKLTTFTSNVGNPSHNDVSQLQTNMSTEFLNAGDISQMPSDFDIFDETPEVTNVNGDILQMQPNFDESPELISVFDAQQFQSGFNLTELSNVNGYQYEIYPEYVNSFHKTNIHQVPIKKNVCKVSQVRQQLSRLDLILSDNQVMQSQMSPLLNDRLDSLYTTLDSYSSYFNQSLGELEESNLHSSRNTNALQDRNQFWITSQSLTNESSSHQTAPTNQDQISDYSFVKELEEGI